MGLILVQRLKVDVVLVPETDLWWHIVFLPFQYFLCNPGIA